jgi:hypothetical protein
METIEDGLRFYVDLLVNETAIPAVILARSTAIAARR